MRAEKQEQAQETSAADCSDRVAEPVDCVVSVTVRTRSYLIANENLQSILLFTEIVVFKQVVRDSKELLGNVNSYTPSPI